MSLKTEFPQVLSQSVAERIRLGHKLASVKQQVAQAISDEFFLTHPEWVDRYGEKGRRFCTADACFHIEFLAGAIEAGSPEAFGDYARWTARMLAARGIAAHTLQENLAQLEKHLSLALLATDSGPILMFLAEGRQACTESGSVSETQPPDDQLKVTRNVFLAAILAGQRPGALSIVEEALRAGHSHTDIYVDVFDESLRRVGELWEQNKISVAQEHMATAITQYAIAAIYPRLIPVASDRGAMVVTGVAGEMHQIGANLVADAMEAQGWRVRFLGSNLPHSSVLAAIKECSANVLCISTTIVANLPSVVELVETVRNNLSEHVPRIVLGGAAYRRAPQFAKEIGAAEAIPDLRQALAILCA